MIRAQECFRNYAWPSFSVLLSLV